MIPTAADAVAASLACARRLGLPYHDPLVVAAGYSVRVLLRPAPVLTRVVTIGRTLRGEPLPWLQREVDVARFLADSGAPVVPPWEDPGPHFDGGLEVSLWEWVEQVPGVLGQAEFGAFLRDLHACLAGYDARLPPLIGPLTDIASARAVCDDAVLHAAADVLVPLALSWPRRPLHGDAHTGNVLLTRHGPLWIDFEDVCAGPPEWDLASRTIGDDAADGYGDVDRQRLAACRDLRALQVLAAVLTDDLQDAGLYCELTDQLRQRVLTSR